MAVSHTAFLFAPDVPESLRRYFPVRFLSFAGIGKPTLRKISGLMIEWLPGAFFLDRVFSAKKTGDKFPRLSAFSYSGIPIFTMSSYTLFCVCPYSCTGG